MSTELQIILWGALCYVVLGLTIVTKRDADTKGVAGMILVGWLVSRAVGVFYAAPDSMWFYPVQDGVFACITGAALISRRTWWKLTLTCCFLLQLCLHTAFWQAWYNGHHEALPFYREVNNGIFSLELLTVSWGAIMDVAGHVVRRVPHWGGSVHLHKARP